MSFFVLKRNLKAFAVLRPAAILDSLITTRCMDRRSRTENMLFNGTLFAPQGFSSSMNDWFRSNYNNVHDSYH